MMLLGWTRLAAPLPLAAYGMPGCASRVPPDAIFVLVGSNNQAKYSLPIPDDPRLVGLRFYHQALVFDASAGNLSGAVVSDAAEGVIGHW